MKNRNLKKTLSSIGILSFFFLFFFSLLNFHLLKKYEYTNNLVIASIIEEVIEKYPEVSEEELVKILNNSSIKKENHLKKYGIDVYKDTISLANEKIKKEVIFLNLILLAVYCLSITILFTFNQLKRDNKIKKLTYYLKEINNKNYLLDPMSNTEDELSILKNEIYKTAIMLNEDAKQAKKDKDSLKDSLSDISHQLKTPLTSISLMIDNLKNKNLTEKQKEELLKNIHRKINTINFLVQSLLKLSKFDANTVVFKNEYCTLYDLFNEVIDSVSAICDLKNISIRIYGNKKDKLYCDYKWQVEAFTNIIKNCIEYSNSNSYIDIFYETNDLFTKIKIKDYGKGMSKEEQKNIFKRFYKGENSSFESVGIGLSLAKVIIEKNNGYIVVSSKINEGSKFIIKYFK